MDDVRTLPAGEDLEVGVTLDDLAREGARRMIAAALEAEVDEYVSSFVGGTSTRTGGGSWCATGGRASAG